MNANDFVVLDWSGGVDSSYGYEWNNREKNDSRHWRESNYYCLNSDKVEDRYR
jgi:hypothetical protein